MFSDRLWIVKAALALALLGWLGLETRRQLSRAHPPVERVALSSDALRDLEIYLAARKVIAADAAGFSIDTKVGPMRILTPTPPRVGQTISAIVRATGPRTMETVALQINEGHEWKRPLNYAVSVLTVIAYLWVIRRRFRWRIEDGVFRSRY